MTRSTSPFFRGPRAAALLAVLFAATLAAAWASQHHPATPLVGPIAPVLLPPAGPVSLSTRAERTAVHQGSDGTIRVEVVLQAENRADLAGRRVPTDVVVLLDRSGSMSGAKVEQAKSAVRDLLDRLSPADRFALVTFNAGATLDLPLQRATPENRAAWDARVASLGAGGGTCIRCALSTGLDHLEPRRETGRSSRVILISDGLDDSAGLVDLARRAPRGEYVLSTVGVGLDFNEQLLTTVADAGTGNFYFLEDSAVLAEVFRGELEASVAMVASGIELTLRPAAGIEVVDAAGYPLERTAAGVVVRPGTLFAGQQRRLWITYRVPTADAGAHGLGGLDLRFADGDRERRIARDRIATIDCVADRTTAIASIDVDAWRESVVKEQYGQLQQAVAAAVQSGRRDEAKAAIEAYVATNAGAQDHFQDDVVAGQLLAAEKLEAEVEEAFSGADQARKRKALSKDNQVKGWNARRQGAKKVEVVR